MPQGDDWKNDCPTVKPGESDADYCARTPRCCTQMTIDGVLNSVPTNRFWLIPLDPELKQILLSMISPRTFITLPSEQAERVRTEFATAHFSANPVERARQQAAFFGARGLVFQQLAALSAVTDDHPGSTLEQARILRDAGLHQLALKTAAQTLNQLEAGDNVAQQAAALDLIGHSLESLRRPAKATRAFAEAAALRNQR